MHDQAAKKEFLSIWSNDRGFIIRSFAGRLRESLAGSAKSDVLSFLFFNNLTYRLLALAGFVAMILRGGDKRLLALPPAALYLIYVVLTCVFYFVGLAYDSVTEVTLLFLFMGGLEAVLSAARHTLVRATSSARGVAA